MKKYHYDKNKKVKNQILKNEKKIKNSKSKKLKN